MKYMKKPKNRPKNYAIQTQFGGWRRIDMLLAIYDKAIAAIRAVQEAVETNDNTTYAIRMAESQKCILAIHSGLKPDEHDVAYNIARLLHFVLLKLEEKNYGEAAHFLELLRSGFAQIYDEAVALEEQGVIPALMSNDSVSSLV